jgi:hypothetical protein
MQSPYCRDASNVRLAFSRAQLITSRDQLPWHSVIPEQSSQYRAYRCPYYGGLRPPSETRVICKSADHHWYQVQPLT